MSQILLLTDRFLPHAGGSRVYYHNLYSHLTADCSERVTILTRKVPGWREFDNVNQTERLRIVRRFSPLPDLRAKHLWKITGPMAEAGWRVRRDKVDIVHAGDFYPQGAISLVLKRAAGVPFLAYCHGEDITLTEIRRFQRPLRNRIYQRADAVIAACEFARQKLLEIGISEAKITRITPGVDWQRFQPKPANPTLVRKLGIENKRVLLTVARLTPRKGHAVVLRALADILPRVPDAVYVIAGTGPERENLETLVKELGIAASVRFAGFVAEQELSDYYNLCDVFVMMNQEIDGDIEGFGMVFLEASAAGKPVVGGRSGGTKDSILDGKTGFLIGPLDIAQLAVRLEQLLLDRNLRNVLGTAGLHRAQRDFSWFARAAQLQAVSNDVIERSRRQRKSSVSVQRSEVREDIKKEQPAGNRAKS